MTDAWQELRASLAPRPRRRWMAPSVAVVAVAVLAALWAHGRGAPRPAPPADPAPTVVGQPAALPFENGVVAWQGARWQVGDADDRVVVGDWDCDGETTLALLRPSTGAVYRFDAWAEAGADLSAPRVGRVAGATSLRAADLDGDGCDELVAETPGGSTVVDASR